MATHRVVWMASAIVLNAAAVRLCAAGQPASPIPSVEELLDKYTRALDATQSFIDFYEATSMYSHSSGPRAPIPVADAKTLERGQHRADGRRTYSQRYAWGDVIPQLGNLPESTPHYNLRLEHNGKLYAHATGVNNPKETGKATWQSLPYKKSVLTGCSYSAIFGFLGADERLDAVLRQATRISVRRATETLNGSACYVIDARTAYGQYTVWLDPTHGCHPARVIRKAQAGDREREHVLPRGSDITAGIDNIRFEQVDGTWVPMEGDSSYHRIFRVERFFLKGRGHFKRTKIILNPDHDALGSFADPRENPVQDPELRNGTRVEIFVTGRDIIRGLWQNGKVLDESGTAIDMSLLGY